MNFLQIGTLADAIESLVEITGSQASDIADALVEAEIISPTAAKSALKLVTEA